jgi:hypothetical protein
MLYPEKMRIDFIALAALSDWQLARFQPWAASSVADGEIGAHRIE